MSGGGFTEMIGDYEMADSEVCSQHCGVKTEIVNIKEDITDNRRQQMSDMKTVFDAVRTKTPLWAFILMIGMVISSLGLQWATYKSITELSMKMAVFETRIHTIERQVCDLPTNRR